MNNISIKFMLIMLLVLSGCQKDSFSISSTSIDYNPKYIANCYNSKGIDQLVLIDRDGKAIDEISRDNNYPSSAVEIDDTLYWQNTKIANNGLVNDFFYINDKIKDNILSPFHINDVVSISQDGSKIMFKNGIYHILTKKYYSTNDPDFILCDWLDDNQVLAVAGAGIIISDNKLRKKRVVKSDINGTYYDVSVSPQEQQIAYLRFDASTGADELVVTNKAFQGEIYKITKAELDVLSLSSPVWLDDGRLLLQGNNPKADIFLIDTIKKSVSNMTSTPQQAEICSKLNYCEKESKVYLFTDDQLKVLDSDSLQQVESININVPGIISITVI